MEFTREQQLIGVHLLRPLTEDQRRDEGIRWVTQFIVRSATDEETAQSMFKTLVTDEYLTDSTRFPVESDPTTPQSCSD